MVVRAAVGSAHAAAAQQTEDDVREERLRKAAVAGAAGAVGAAARKAAFHDEIAVVVHAQRHDKGDVTAAVAVVAAASTVAVGGAGATAGHAVQQGEAGRSHPYALWHAEAASIVHKPDKGAAVPYAGIVVDGTGRQEQHGGEVGAGADAREVAEGRMNQKEEDKKEERLQGQLGDSQTERQRVEADAIVAVAVVPAAAAAAASGQGRSEAKKNPRHAAVAAKGVAAGDAAVVAVP
jgi:hypothetical protein